MKDITEIKTVSAPQEIVKNKKAEKKNGHRIGYNYIIYKSLKESQKNDVVKCMYIKGLFDFGVCVIKEGTYGDSKDKHGRDIIDRLQWQQKLHEELQGKVRVPRLISSFEENGNYYLVIEMIKGISLNKFIKNTKDKLLDAIRTDKGPTGKILNYQIQVIELLDKLHKQQVVHRDVTPANFMITPSGKVALIDLELSYSTKHQFPSPAFALGTHGYMSPEQLITSTPTIHEDVFAAGAILLQIWGGIHPSKITEGPYDEIIDRVRFLVHDKEIADIIIQCLDPKPTNRPLLTEVHKKLLTYKDDIRRKIIRRKSDYKYFSNAEIMQTVQSGIDCLSSSVLSDEEGWYAANIENPSGENHKINKARYASFSHGDSGIIYMLAKAKQVGLNTDLSLSLIEKGMERIKQKYILRPDQFQPGLYNGSDGMAVALSEGIHHGLIEPTLETLGWIEKLLEKESESYNLFTGKAGQGYANIYCSNTLKQPLLIKRLGEYVQYLIANQEKDGSWIRSVIKKKKRITRGFANGVAGIAHFLLTYAQQYNNNEALLAGERGLTWLVKHSTYKNGALQWKSATKQFLPAWWNEGSPGVALAFIKGYEITTKQLYKKYATEALYSNPARIIDNNLSQQQGLSGLGEIYLEAHRLLGDAIWQERATWIAQVIMHLRKSHRKHGAFWLVEDEREPVPNFMTGNSGVLHFLLRYCNPEKVGLPLIS